MSYILDALKRADTERERGAVPGLHTRQMTNPSDRAAPSGRTPLWLGVAAVVALGGIGAGLWVWQMPVRTTQQVILAPLVSQPPVDVPVAPVAVIAATQKPVPVAPMRPPTVATPGAPSAARVKPKPEPVTAPVEAASAPLAVVPLLSELSEDFRRQLPALTITGAVYSANPAKRALLVNNLVLTPGNLVAPEVTLEEIHPRSSVFSFRGTRFRVAH